MNQTLLFGTAKSKKNVRPPRIWLGAILLILILLPMAESETIRVRYPQGSTHGFVALRTLDGKIIATGEATQTVRGFQVTSRLTFHFRDGSIDDDETVFLQKGLFRLLSDHHIQHGPSFPKPTDLLINAVDGELIWRDQDGTTKQTHMDLPEDLSNGLPPNLLLNISLSTAETKVSYIVPGKKPRLIHISIKPIGAAAFSVGTLRRKATDFALHVELGGITGVVAPIIGKQPPDFHIWLQDRKPPASIREESALYEGGPIWRIEQLSPTLR